MKLTLLFCIVLSVPATAQTAQPARPQLVLEDVSSVVEPGDTLRIAVSIRPAAPPGVDLAVAVHPPVGSRSEFTLAAEGTLSRSPIELLTYDVAELPRRAGALVIERPIAGGTRPQMSPLRLRLEGVYPVTVSLRQRDGTDIDSLVTFFVHFPEPRLPPFFRVGLVLPFRAPATRVPDGTLGTNITSTIEDRLRPFSSLISAARRIGIPLTVSVRPGTLDEWEEAASSSAALGLGLTEVMTPAVEYLAETYAGLPASVVADARLQAEVDAQIVAGRDALTRRGVTPDISIALSPSGPVGERSLRRLRSAGAERFVLEESVLEPLDLALTLTRPFLVDIDGTTSQALAPDSGLSTLLARTTDEPRALAARIFAELAVLYLDAPGEQRGVVLVPAGDGVPDPLLWDSLLRDIGSARFMLPVTLSRWFADLSLARDGADAQRRLVRTLRTSEQLLPPALVRSLLSARARLENLSRMTGPGAGVERGERLLAIAESTPSGVGPWLEEIDRVIAAEVSHVKLLTAGSVTLAASAGRIPITLQNAGPAPVTVRVSLSSERLRFPEGRARIVVLEPRSQTVLIEVESLTSGRFPLLVSVSSPCMLGASPGPSDCPGRLDIAEARVSVTSTKASGVAVVLAAGALIFLLLWWGREVVVRPRRRRGEGGTRQEVEGDMVRNDSGQVSLIKVFIVLVIFAFIVVDCGRPFVIRVNMDKLAHEVALESAQTWKTRGGDEEAAKLTADEEAAKRNLKVAAWEVSDQGTVTVTVEREVSSWLFKRIVKGWYTVRETASERFFS